MALVYSVGWTFKTLVFLRYAGVVGTDPGNFTDTQHPASAIHGLKRACMRYSAFFSKGLVPAKTAGMTQIYGRAPIINPVPVFFSR